MFYPEFESQRREFLLSNPKYQALVAPMKTVCGAVPLKAEFGLAPAEAIPDETAPPPPAAPLPEAPSAEMAPEEAAPGELVKHYAFDATGHIMTATTADSTVLSPELKALTTKAIVFYSMLNAALHSRGADLSDYGKVSEIIDRLGVFTSMGSQDRTFRNTETDLALNLAIIKDVLGSLNLIGNSLQIVKSIITGIGDQLKVKAESSLSTAEVAYPLLVCEELMGVPIVTVTLFYLKATEMESVLETNCLTHAESTVTFDYHQENYLFVDPAYIDHFPPDLLDAPDYAGRIAEIAACLKD